MWISAFFFSFCITRTSLYLVKQAKASLKFSWRSRLTQPVFQRPINVVSMLWINVEITLIRRWKWNKIWRRIFNVAQRWNNVSARRWNNVETTLHNVETTLIQRCFTLASTLVKTILNPIGLVMIMDLQIHEKFLFC